MTTTLVRPVERRPGTLRGRLAERRLLARQNRLLARQDRLAARLIELRCIAELTSRAEAVIEAGWIQRGWYRYAPEDRAPEDRAPEDRAPEDKASGGRAPKDRASGDGQVDRPIVGACLVGAIVHVAGGPQAFNTQLVQRSLDLTWNTLYGVAGDSLAWCPPPSVRTSHLRDLTRWNDRPSRTRDEVCDLLAATKAEAGRLSDLIRAQRLELSQRLEAVPS
jgi:hypothetical protein